MRKIYQNQLQTIAIVFVFLSFFTISIFAQTEVAILIPGDIEASDEFGKAVSISGEIAIAGAHGEDTGGSDAGAAYIFQFDNGVWVEVAKLQANDKQAFDYFGKSVSIDGNRVVVGAPGEDSGGSNAGASYIFEPINGVWTEVAKIQASDKQAVDIFGHSVSINGDRIVVGSLLEDAGAYDAGAVYIFDYVNGVWVETAKLLASDAEAGDRLGQSVSLQNNRLIVGANWEDTGGSNAGSAYIFEFDGNSWVEVVKIQGSDTDEEDYFGNSVSLDGDRVIIGAVVKSSHLLHSGAAYIFELDNGNWVEVIKLEASTIKYRAQFGGSVSLSGDRALIGASFESTGYSQAGAAYVFEVINGVWEETVKLQASNKGTKHHFGISVSLDGDLAIIGAENETTGGYDAGAAYIFEWEPSNLPPVAICQDLVLSADEFCQANVTASDVDNASYDPDEDEITLSLSPEGPYPLGETLVTLTVTDPSGETNQCTAMITVIDETSPVADLSPLPGLVGECSVDITVPPTATDNCAGSITGSTTDPLSYTEQGTYLVTWTYDDGNGNIALQEQNVIVADQVLPIADVMPLPIISGECQVQLSTPPTASDNCNGTITGSTTDPLIYTEQGTYVVIWTYDDGNGNIAMQEQNIVVNDQTMPLADIVPLPVISGECQVQITTWPTATDNCGGSITAFTLDPLIYNEQGTYTITWLYDDGNGNIATQDQTIIVDDITAPELISISEPIVLWPPNHKYVTFDINDFIVSVTDNCTNVSVDDVYFKSASSDEPEDANGNGDGKTYNDIVLADNCKSIKLRKERQGNGNGRFYTVYLGIDDGNGNFGEASCHVTVPHNKNSDAVNDDAVYWEFAPCDDYNKSAFVNSNIEVEEFKLVNYPNPFNGKTTIAFTVYETGPTILKVYSSLGKEIDVVFDREAKAGIEYAIEFDALKLPKGIYFYHLQSGKVNAVKKMLLVY